MISGDSSRSEQKASLRTTVLAHRKTLNKNEVLCASSAVRARLVAYLERFQGGPRAICLYSAIHNEVNVLPLFNIYKNMGSVCFFPKIEGNVFNFHPVQGLNQLSPGAFSIAEPSGGNKYKILCFSAPLVLVPGIAFSKQGQRLGYGKGYYDRSIRVLLDGGVRPHLVGVAYDFQITDALPQEATDIPVDVVITEKRVYFRK